VNKQNRDIADYYNQTLIHYRKWWKLDQVLSLHYGYWKKDTRNFAEALENTNKYMAGLAGIKKGDHVLDAGCGVGGSSFYLARDRNARVTGITLSEKQLDFAKKKCNELKLQGQVDFLLGDFSKTSFEDSSFDVVWAIESFIHVEKKKALAKEVARILKPAGRLIIADYFKPDDQQKDPRNWLGKWQSCWSLADFLTIESYSAIFHDHGLKLIKNENITDNIYPSAKRMYWSSLIGALPSVMYNTFHDTSRYAKTHYKSGYYQYKALKNKLWEYHILMFEKERN
jgi:cyclopropane fatty-acyl-phospholipid synthase-like methyltransferase